MAIYNNFLFEYIKQRVDLLSEEYKIALFTSDLASLGPHNFTTYSGAQGVSYTGAEVEGPGYTKGGKSISFTGPRYVGDGQRVEYYASAVEWTHARFRARYAIIYKVDENPDKTYLVASYYFGDDKVSTGGSFKLSFSKMPALVISLTPSGSTGTGSGSGTCGCDTDDNLDYNSFDSLKNSSLTKILSSIGVRFDDENTSEDEDPLPEEAAAISDSVDVMSRVGSSQIAKMFGEEEDPEPDPPTPPTPGTIETDSELSWTSEDAVRNKTLTETFGSLGVLVGEDDDIPESATAVDGYVDMLNEASNTQIDAIFGKSHEIRITYMASEGIILGSEKRESTKVFELPNFPDNLPEGYKIEGWYRDGKRYMSLVGRPGDKIKLTRNITLYAKVEKDV